MKIERILDILLAAVLIVLAAPIFAYASIRDYIREERNEE